MAQLKPVRPRPRSGSLADQVRALACRDVDDNGRKLGALNDAELEAWCSELAERVAEFTAGDQSARIAELEAERDGAIRAGHKRIVELEGVVAERDAELASLRQIIAALTSASLT